MRRGHIFLFAFLGLAFWCTSARAELYRYLDRDGVWRFSNRRVSQQYRKWIVGHEKFEVDDQANEVLGAGMYDDLFIAAAKEAQIAPALLKAVAAQESGFNPRALSVKGAMGLMQLMPGTAKMLKVENPFDPEAAIIGGARYLRILLDTFAGSIKLALAAYNCGPELVRRAMAVPAIEETQDYVRRVLRFYTAYSGKTLEREAFEEIQ